jgi:hypothetical protein
MISPTRATQLMRAAVSLNETLGDPTMAVPKPKSRG